MQLPELSLFVFCSIIGAYNGALLTTAFLIICFKLDKRSKSYFPSVFLVISGFSICSSLQIVFAPYLGECVVFVFGPMADWIRGVNNFELEATSAIAASILTVLIGLKKLQYY